jgi:cation diffusion facilitator CzcD-associated flavoprotein CzcO
LRAEKCFSTIDVYEQRDSSGGLWQYYPATHADSFFRVPQTQPELGRESPIPSTGTKNGKIFLTPVYDSLETNIPRQMMQFSDYAFDPHLPLYPRHDEVLEYLRGFASDVLDSVRFNNQVLNVTYQPLAGNTTTGVKDQWLVESLNISSGSTKTDEYDAIVVSNGHYAVPYIPNISGLALWENLYPGSITHSKYFRNATGFSNKRVVVVGNSASGLDVASQLTTTCQLPLYRSQKSTSEMSVGVDSDTEIRTMSEIIRVNPFERRVSFQNGVEIEGIDAIVFCTGYFYSFPFLKSSFLDLITDGSMVHGTFQHIFNAKHPSLSFLALPQKVIPFPIAELQAAVVARVLSGRLKLPSTEIMQDWERQRLEKCERSDRFHTLGYPSDADYMDQLIDWAERAEPNGDLENEGRGKTARAWTTRERWIRKRVPLIKKSYADKGNERFKIKTVEELGFVFENSAEE